MKKQLFIGCAIIALFICVAVTPSFAQSKGKCTEWYWDWNGTGDVWEGPMYIWLNGDGTFVTDAVYPEYLSGTWSENKGVRVLVYPPIVDPLQEASFWAGKKNSGYMTDDLGSAPGVWYNKGTDKKKCAFVTE